jgi:uncharacterized membrane protein
MAAVRVLSSTRTISDVIRQQQPAISLYAAGLMAMGAVSVIYRDFAYTWQPVPAFSGRSTVAVLCGLFMIFVSIALLFPRTATIAVRALFPFLIVWFCLKIPAVVAAFKIEGVWIGLGEVGMLLAGGWVLFACLSGLNNAPFFHHITGQRGIRMAQILFGLAVIPVGLSHILYLQITTSLVPSWLPFRTELAFLTGAGQMFCGLAILLCIYPRVAALVETAMLTLFAFLAWGPDTWFAKTPKMAGTPPGFRFPFTAFLITWVIASAALLIATNSRPAPSLKTEP